MSRVWSLKDLSPGAASAVRARKIEGDWNLAPLLAVLDELERWDRATEFRIKVAKWIMGGGVLACVGFLVLTIVLLSSDYESWNPVIGSAGAFLISLGAAIFGAKRLIKEEAKDQPNEIRNLIRPVLRQFRQDLDPHQKLKVEIDLQRIIDSKPKSTRKLPPGLRSGTIEESLYEEPVCSIRMPLADGSAALLRIENSYRRRVRSYSNSRGKSKSKTKWKKYSTVTGILIPAPGMEWHPNRVQGLIHQQQERLEFVEKDGLRSARLDRYYKFVSQSDPSNDTAPVKDAIRIFLRLALMRPTPPALRGGAR